MTQKTPMTLKPRVLDLKQHPITEEERVWRLRNLIEHYYKPDTTTNPAPAIPPTYSLDAHVLSML